MSENTTTSKLQKNAELIFTYVYNNKIIFISGFVLIIAIIAGILIYNMNIENADKIKKQQQILKRLWHYMVCIKQQISLKNN